MRPERDLTAVKPGAEPAAQLRQRIQLAADRAMAAPYFLWDWGEVIAMDGLLCASDATGLATWRDWVYSRLDLWRLIHPQPFWPDHLGPGVALIRQFEHTRNVEVLDYAEQLARHLMSLPATTTGARLLRPDKPDIDHFAWVDSLYTDGPFLCALGRVTGNTEYIDEGARHTIGLCASLQDTRTGLFAHRYDDRTGQTNGVFWGRGCGWAALGLGHTLALLPVDHPARHDLVERTQHFATSAMNLQTSTGHWRAVIDHPATSPESSTTALIAEGLARAMDAGAIGTEYATNVHRAWNAVRDDVQPDGVVANVSQRSPSSRDWQDYAMLPHGGCYAWGQGPWLLLACRILNADDISIASVPIDPPT